MINTVYYNIVKCIKECAANKINISLKVVLSKTKLFIKLGVLTNHVTFCKLPQYLCAAPIFRKDIAAGLFATAIVTWKAQQNVWVVRGHVVDEYKAGEVFAKVPAKLGNGPRTLRLLHVMIIYCEVERCVTLVKSLAQNILRTLVTRESTAYGSTTNKTYVNARIGHCSSKYIVVNLPTTAHIRECNNIICTQPPANNTQRYFNVWAKRLKLFTFLETARLLYVAY